MYKIFTFGPINNNINICYSFLQNNGKKKNTNPVVFMFQSIIALRDLQQQILLVSSKVSSQQAFNENTQFWINEKFTML